ncbi:TAF1 transcription initiation factor TFIID subunit TAF1 [Flagelloscypha sp. PMI_526]|nr:TAF1 transcription initiation factor TFIID subunit TAF1 [Flagelloscypha sp. PMI_526]
MAGNEETEALEAIAGFGLDYVLGELQLPPGSSPLGMAGTPHGLTQSQFLGQTAVEEYEGAIGLDQGFDYEDQVDFELGDEEDFDGSQPFTTSFTGRQKRFRVVKKFKPRQKSVYECFPDFRPDSIPNFNQLFGSIAGGKSRLVYPRRKTPPRNFLTSIVAANQTIMEEKRSAELVSASNIDNDLRTVIQNRRDMDVPLNTALNDREFDLVHLSNWEDQIVYGPEQPPPMPAAVNSLVMPKNRALESGAWTQSIIWSPTAPFHDLSQIEISDKDALVPDETNTVIEPPIKRRRMDTRLSEDALNFSNDKFYGVTNSGARRRVRQTFSQLSVDHSYPAQKLQLPFFKTRLTKQEARSFHRPALRFPQNMEIRFAKVRMAKKKKDSTGRSVVDGGNVAEGLHQPGDMSLSDTSNFVLWEFSEEYPTIIQNFGMSSFLVNYHRKKNEKDEHVPRYDLGVPFILEPQDESPFMRLGSVNPGQTIPTIYNNLMRAPLFRHKPQPTDFLVIRQTVKGEAKYYIRDIKHLFVVGQIYPVINVPGPHSRQITQTVKSRLQVITFKLLRKSKEERLKLSRLMKYFPDHNELQMRQRLKEFMEYHRRGDHQGFWRLKDGWAIPTDDEMFKMVTPEQVVLAESMQVGQQHLEDSGYNLEEHKEADELDLPIEQQLAPWITTKNFLKASQQQAMLRLHGEGDPSGRGEAFNFIRISMKNIFVKARDNYELKLAEAENRPKSAHRYNVAEQRQAYKSEVERIWKAQFDSLNRKEPPLLTAEDEQRFEEGKIAGATMKEQESSEDAENCRILRIRRKVNGIWKTEIVRDPAVIRAYVKRRLVLEEESTPTEMLMPTGDPEKDARAYKRLQEEWLQRVKNQQRRIRRKNERIAAEGGTLLHLRQPMKPDTTRHCGNCGQMGHMKTNRKCPRWHEFHGPQSEAAKDAGLLPPKPSASVSSFNLGGMSSRTMPAPKVSAAAPATKRSSSNGE